jgi:AraC family transcriptional regulator, regulatory protein of adaptative response / methylated-DNA-[protein]-cysteine methyltransferase
MRMVCSLEFDPGIESVKKVVVKVDAAKLDAVILPSRSEMERAYLERDAAFDGVFFTAVRTTKIFCRPTCPARKPFPKNVEFFASLQAAQFAGYRACKRCRPLEDSDQPAWISDLLAAIAAKPNKRFQDADLKAFGIDPSTVRRYFKITYGMSFQAFTRAQRLQCSRAQLEAGVNIDTVILESGYESHSGFRAAFTKAFGQTPGALVRK